MIFILFSHKIYLYNILNFMETISYKNHFTFTCSNISCKNKVCKLEIRISCKNAQK